MGSVSTSPAQEPVQVGDIAAIWLDAISRIDGCPRPECTNTEAPKSWAEVERGYLLAYLCADCGAAWTYETKEK